MEKLLENRLCSPIFSTYLELSMPVDVFGSLAAEDEFSFIGHSDQVILHGVTQQPGEKADGYHPTQLLHKCIYHRSVFHIRIIRM